MINPYFVGNRGLFATIGTVTIKSKLYMSNMTIEEGEVMTPHFVALGAAQNSSLSLNDSIISGVRYYYLFQGVQFSTISLINMRLETSQLYGISYILSNSEMTIQNSTIAEKVLHKCIVTANDNSRVCASNVSVRNNFIPDSHKGCLFCVINGTIQIKDSSFVDNTMYGGQLIFIKDNSEIVGENCQFVNTTGRSGAILKCRSSGSAHLTSSFFMNNHAMASGGVLYSDSCQINIYDSNMSSNKATGNGGCIITNSFMKVNALMLLLGVELIPDTFPCRGITPSPGENFRSVAV